MKPKFTLIELLVVVAILGILMTLLLPSLQSARDKAKAAVCVSNLKQLNIALYSYTGTNKGYLPGGLWWGMEPRYKANSGNFGRYLSEEAGHPEPTGVFQNFELLDCPSFTKAVSGCSNGQAKQFQSYGKDSDNRRYFGYPAFNGDPARSPLPITSVEDPVDENSLTENDSFLTNSKTAWNGDLSEAPRHGFKAGSPYRTMLYFDGHALLTIDRPNN